MSEELISALREGVDGDPNIGLAPANDAMREAADTIEAQAAEIKRLREAGTKLAGFAGHDSECEDVTGAYPGSCSCGYSRTWKAWNQALGEPI